MCRSTLTVNTVLAINVNTVDNNTNVGDDPGDILLPRIALEDQLLPTHLRYSLTDLVGGMQEWKGLTLLVSVMDGSRRCIARRGEIIAEYDHNVTIVLRFTDMLRERLCWLGHKENERKFFANSIYLPSSHLDIAARRKENDEWEDSACVVATNSQCLPVTDVAASFVMWADSGFPEMPMTLSHAISYVKGDQTHEEFIQRREKEERDEQLRLERMGQVRQEASLHTHEQVVFTRRLEDREARVSIMGWRELMAEHQSIKAHGRAALLEADDIVLHSLVTVERLLFPEHFCDQTNSP